MAETTAYQVAQKIAKAMRQDEWFDAFGNTHTIEAWSKDRMARFAGSGEQSPGVCWEDGPYEWAVDMTLEEQPSARFNELAREHGFYMECWNGFIVTLHPLP